MRRIGILALLVGCTSAPEPPWLTHHAPSEGPLFPEPPRDPDASAPGPEYPAGLCEVDEETRALPRENEARPFLYRAVCEALQGRLVFALRAAAEALELGRASQDPRVLKLARARTLELLPRIPHVTFVPADEDVVLGEVTFDDRSVPLDALGTRYSLDPGTHLVTAQGVRNHETVTMRKELRIEEGDSVRILLELR